MADAAIHPTADEGPLTDRGFWGIFAAAWLAYIGLFFSVGTITEGGSPAWALGVALTNAGPAAAMAVVVALRRRDLLRPERSLGRTMLVHLGVGFIYAVTTAVIITLLVSLLGYEEPDLGEAGRAGMMVYRAAAGGVLYTVLAGFLMWSESIRRVHESRTMAAREAALRARAEAKAVRAQFNPHFVFNTLHSLMLLVRADPAAAERAIEDVATLIRYASILQRKDIDTVPLAKELEVARRYAGLEQLRLEDRLRVSWTVDVDPSSVAIPAFALQTLLENAIKHGIEPRAEGGKVAIQVTSENGVLAVTVSDDGEGAEPERVRAAEGHGLQLLEQRLEALYGEAASLAWETDEGEGFTASIRLPAQPPGSVPELGVIHALDAGQ
jgi:two-component sensor histidine kinase